MPAPNFAARALRTGTTRFSPAGFSLIEMLMALAIMMVMAAVALPFLFGNRRSYQLTSASTAAAGAIQAARYKAIMTGCATSIAFTTGSTNYQMQYAKLVGTPPACDTTWSNLGNATPWSTSSYLSVSPTTTLQFCPNGTQIIPGSPTLCGSSGAAVTWGSLTLSNGFTTNTITVSGVGNVKVTQP